ncbi:MAG: YHS domain-containing (seleno)protein [Myxococcota bacterium]
MQKSVSSGGISSDSVRDRAGAPARERARRLRAVLLSILALGLFAATGSLAASPGEDPAASAPSPDERILVNRDHEGVALQGYDPVAYFTDGRPTKGDPRHHSTWQDATYHFASAEHKRLFDADPARYAPAYGGYCGYAASIDRLSPVSPLVFDVVEGRLVLQHNQKAYDLWHRDVAASLAAADRNWPGLVERNGTGRTHLVNTDGTGLALQGYDPLAYFEEGRAVRGSAEHEAVYDGARYHFTSEERRAKFESDPAKYVPAFGGYCAYAASIDKISPIDPEIFQIEDGRLLLQHTQKAYDLFNADTPGNLKRADANWPGLVAKNGTRSGGPSFARRVRNFLGL